MKEAAMRLQADLLERYSQEGFVDVRKLASGTFILIETEDEVYEMEVGTPERSVVLVGSDVRFERRIKAVVTGCLDSKFSVFVPKIFAKDTLVIMRSSDIMPPLVRTKPVQGVKITGKNYTYRLWVD